jgi:uncharacterized Zn-finger protein
MLKSHAARTRQVLNCIKDAGLNFSLFICPLSSSRGLRLSLHVLLITAYYPLLMSDINSEFTLSSDSDSEDSDHSIQTVAPPSEGATLEHFQKVLLSFTSLFWF